MIISCAILNWLNKNDKNLHSVIYTISGINTVFLLTLNTSIYVSKITKQHQYIN